jgi:hypothetical protein
LRAPGSKLCGPSKRPLAIRNRRERRRRRVERQRALRRRQERPAADRIVDAFADFAFDQQELVGYPLARQPERLEAAKVVAERDMRSKAGSALNGPAGA